jgi:hypothetical protein
MKQKQNDSGKIIRPLRGELIIPQKSRRKETTMRIYGRRSRIVLLVVATLLSLILWGRDGVIYATGNQGESPAIAQNTGKTLKKTSVVKLTKKDLRRINDGGPVEVTVLYVNPLGQEGGAEISFEVRMNTHSVDLEAYEMEKICFLRVDNGAEQKALGWFKPGGGGHHRSGMLKFAGPISPNAQFLQLIIRGIGGVQERVFEWKLPLESR